MVGDTDVELIAKIKVEAKGMDEAKKVIDFYKDVYRQMGLSIDQYNKMVRVADKYASVSSAAGGEAGRQMRWIARDVIRLSSMIDKWLSGISQVWSNMVNYSEELTTITEDTDREWQDAYAAMGDATSGLESALQGVSASVARFIATTPGVAAVAGVFVKVGTFVKDIVPPVLSLTGFILLLRHSLMGIAEEAGITSKRFGVLGTAFEVVKGTIMGTLPAQRDAAVAERQLNNIRRDAGALIYSIGQKEEKYRDITEKLAEGVLSGGTSIETAAQIMEKQEGVSEDYIKQLYNMAGAEKAQSYNLENVKGHLQRVEKNWSRLSKVMKYAVPIAMGVNTVFTLLNPNVSKLGKTLSVAGTASFAAGMALQALGIASGPIAPILEVVGLALSAIAPFMQEDVKVSQPLIKALEDLGYEGAELYETAERITGVFQSTKQTFGDTLVTDEGLTNAGKALQYRLEELGFVGEDATKIFSALGINLNQTAQLSLEPWGNTFNYLQSQLDKLGQTAEGAMLLFRMALENGTITEQEWQAIINTDGYLKLLNSLPDAGVQFIEAMRVALLTGGITKDEWDAFFNSPAADDTLKKLNALAGFALWQTKALLDNKIEYKEWDSFLNTSDFSALMALFPSQMTAFTNTVKTELLPGQAIGKDQWDSYLKSSNFDAVLKELKDPILINALTAIQQTINSTPIDWSKYANLSGLTTVLSTYTPPTISVPVKPYFDLSGLLGGVWSFIAGAFSNLISNIQKIPGYQTGGYVPTTGLAWLHAGEYVIPRGESRTANLNVTVNIDRAYLESEQDIEALSRSISERIAVEARRGGIFS